MGQIGRFQPGILVGAHDHSLDERRTDSHRGRHWRQYLGVMDDFGPVSDAGTEP